jgi:hypothetical protein
MFNFLLGVFATLLVKEVIDYLPALGRWLIRRAVRKFPEPEQAAALEKWLSIAATLPGGGVTKVLWGAVCNLLAAHVNKGAAHLVHVIFGYVYLRVQLGDFIKLKFATPREIRMRWRFFQMLGDQALAAGDPNAKQPFLELAEKVQDEKTKRALLAMVDAMKKSKEKPPDLAP